MSGRPPALGPSLALSPSLPRALSDAVLRFFSARAPHSLGQKPITFFRQVLALCDCPTLLDNPDVDKLFPSDAIARAQALLQACPGGTGAYSMSKGIQICREAIARGIEKRDGFPSDPN